MTLDQMSARYAILPPFILSFVLIFSIYIGNLTEVRFGDFINMVLVHWFLCLIVYFFVRLLLKDRLKSSVLTTVVVFLNSTNGLAIYALTELGIAGPERARYRLITLGAAVVAGITIACLLARAKNIRIAFSAAVAFVLILLAQVIIVKFPLRFLMDLSLSSKDDYSIEDFLEIEMIGLPFDLEEKPDVYFLVLDGYMGQEQLKKYFDYDNRDFIEELRKRGFHVVEDSRSNYIQTVLSLPATLNMEYFSKSVMSNVELTRLQQNNKVMRLFSRLGYKIDTVVQNSNFEPLNVDRRHYKFLTVDEFVVAALRQTYTGELVYRSGILEMQASSTILRSFDILHSLASRDKIDPAFVYFHVLLPHAPYFFKPNGELYENVVLNWRQAGDERYIDQIKFGNPKILQAIDALLMQDPRPVIFLQSDHGQLTIAAAEGSGLTSFEKPSFLQVDQFSSNLNAMYFPDGDYSLLHRGITPINTFRIFIKKYIEPSFPLKKDITYYMTYGRGVVHIMDISEYNINSAWEAEAQ